jgi:hypothetical protein
VLLSALEAGLKAPIEGKFEKTISRDVGIAVMRRSTEDRAKIYFRRYNTSHELGI